MTIVLKKLTAAHADDVEAIDGSFHIKSRLLLSSSQNIVDFTVVPAELRVKRYEHDNPDDLASYIGAETKLAIIAYNNQRPAGLLLVSENWNGYAIVDSIKVDISHRKAGIGRMLLDAAMEWARSRNLSGIMLETQDNNVDACLFYQRYGFILRGFDTGIYSAIPATHDETALFWYLLF